MPALSQPKRVSARHGFCSESLTCGGRESLFSKKAISGGCLGCSDFAGSRSRCYFFSRTVVAVSAQSSAPAPAAPPVEQRKTSEPYTGDLSVFDSPGREERLQINRVMDILGIVPGKAVADIGAGSGWFTVRAARRVGESGLVYAVDINPGGDPLHRRTSTERAIAECEDRSWARPITRFCRPVRWMRCCCSRPITKSRSLWLY